MKKGRFAWAIAYGAVLCGFTAFVLLDTFTLPTAYDTDAGKMNLSLFEGTDEAEATTSGSSAEETSTAERSRKSRGGSDRGAEKVTEAVTDPAESAEAVSAGTSYSDENITVTLTEYYENNTAIYVADVQLSSAQYLKAAFADDTYGRNITEKTSVMAEENGAILAINGDYYGAKESGYVIRNGILYRDSGSSGTDVLCIYADGHFEMTDSSEKTAQELIDEGVWQAFSFGPALIENGEISVSEGEEVDKAMASNPRTAIGIIDDLHYIFVVSDGRTSASEGLSLSELAEFMQGLGVTAAYNLDGGGSSTMYFGGEVVNTPTTSGRSVKERSVSDIVYIGY